MCVYCIEEEQIVIFLFVQSACEAWMDYILMSAIPDIVFAVFMMCLMDLTPNFCYECSRNICR